MTTDARMTCDLFADQLGPYLEGDLGTPDAAALEAHAARCAECGALLADLRRLSADARALPALAPSRDLWAGIEARIDAPVLELSALGSRPSASTVTRRRWVLPSMAAAALVLVTAGVTYQLTRASMSGAAGEAPATPIAQVATTDAPVAPTVDAVAASPAPSLASNLEPGSEVAPPASSPSAERREPSASSAPRARFASTSPASPASPAASSLEREISQLRRIVRERRGLLDSTTVQVLERNLTIIDAAIADSRAALERDPASGFLNDQLNTVLERKVRLLRTAALLPVRS